MSAIFDLHEAGVLTKRQHHELTVEGEHRRASLLWIDSQLGHVDVVVVSLLTPPSPPTHFRVSLEP